MARPPVRARAGPARTGADVEQPRHWWQQARWSVLSVLAIVLVMAGVAAVLARNVSGALPVVGKDELGEDPWTDPIGIEKAGLFQLAHVPDCAAGPIVRILLWDAESNPFWQVSGPPTPMATFAVGATPPGFTVDTPYTPPPPDAVIRLVVIRSVKGAAGVRYSAQDLRPNRVVSMLPLTRFTLGGFQTADVCGDAGKAKKPGEGVTTSVPGATTIGG